MGDQTGPYHRAHPQGRYLAEWFGVAVRCLVSAEESGGRLTLLSYQLPPHTPAPPAHLHAHTWEMLLPLHGLLAVTADAQLLTLTPGVPLLIRSGVRHTFFNPSASQTICLAVSLPGGCERYFAELAEGPSQPSVSRAMRYALGQLHDLYLDDPS
jgi:mannose-6-phosphate isomerase-like protein (cupin superfamily)